MPASGRDGAGDRIPSTTVRAEAEDWIHARDAKAQMGALLESRWLALPGVKSESS